MLLQSGIAMNISLIVRDAKLPIVSVSKLRDGGFNTVLTQGSMRIEGADIQESNLLGIKPRDFGDAHMLATINVATNKSLRDEGGRGAWRQDYHALVRAHARFRKQLYNPAKTQSLPDGVHLGIARPTRVA